MDWNEIEYISWQEYKDMAPSIIQLEISHITRLLSICADDIDLYNALISARYAVRQFSQCLQATQAAPIQEACLNHLNTAILKLTTVSVESSPEVRKTLRYISEHLQSIANRGRLVYT